ncbi:MAG TPA: hypothetical protein VKM54_24545 [Myxococcota bacterium]|nr:hypothetical protein [Myxococcota bacterium]
MRLDCDLSAPVLVAAAVTLIVAEMSRIVWLLLPRATRTKLSLDERLRFETLLSELS